MQDKNNRLKGFTLIELLVVVLIIGILASIALPQYQKAVEKSRAVEAVSFISTLEKAIDLWVLSNGPADADKMLENNDLDISFPCLSFDSDGCCLTKDFRYCPYCRRNGTCEIDNYRINSSTYYPLIAWRDNNGNWTRKCGYFDEAGKAVCKGLAANGWEAEEEWDY